jgi:predicted nucleotidyltransferase
MTDADILAEAVRRIREAYAPRCIVLFGSRARGEAQADSHFDLLVVVDGAPDLRRLTADMRWSLCGLPASFDLLVEPAQHWQKWRHVGPAFEHAIDSEGVVLHEAA